jgi:hypothetical protein
MLTTIRTLQPLSDREPALGSSDLGRNFLSFVNDGSEPARASEAVVLQRCDEAPDIQADLP